MPSAPALVQVRHVDEQAGVDLQRDARAVLGDRRHLAQRLVAALPLGAEADLVGIGGDHVGGGPQVHLAGLRVDDHGVAGRHPLDEAARLADRGDAQARATMATWLCAPPSSMTSPRSRLRS